MNEQILLMNCANLRFGGGKTVGLNILHYFKNNWVSNTRKLIIIAPYNAGYEQFKGDSIIIEIIPDKYHKPWFKPLLNYLKLPSLVKKYKPGFVFSLGNIAFKSTAPQMVLIHNAYTVYPESPVWKKLTPKYLFVLRSMVKIITSSIKYADYVFVQTETMKQRMNEVLKIPMSRLGILPNSVSFTSNTAVSPLNLDEPGNEIKLLFLSKLYPHKNFEILIPLAKKINEKNLAISITITLGKNDSKESDAFLQTIQQQGLQSIIRNAGDIDVGKIAEAYQSHHGLLLPTLLESFSGTYVEAMHFGRPVFTSRLDFAEEVCRDAAYYFNPNNATDILTTIEQAFSNKKELQQKVEKGRLHAASFKSWQQIGDELKTFVEMQMSKV